MWCWDEVSCTSRNVSTAFEMTSHGWPPRLALSGIFSNLPTISPVANYNKVYLQYCSSDACPCPHAAAARALREGGRILLYRLFLL